MEPVGYIPATPALRKKLKQRNELSIEVVVGELKLGKAEFSGTQMHSEENFRLRELKKFISRQVQHRHNVFIGEKLKRGGSIHGITFVGQLSVMKESSIA